MSEPEDSGKEKALSKSSDIENDSDQENRDPGSVSTSISLHVENDSAQENRDPDSDSVSTSISSNDQNIPSGRGLISISEIEGGESSVYGGYRDHFRYRMPLSSEMYDSTRDMFGCKFCRLVFDDPYKLQRHRVMHHLYRV